VGNSRSLRRSMYRTVRPLTVRRTTKYGASTAFSIDARDRFKEPGAVLGVLPRPRRNVLLGQIGHQSGNPSERTPHIVFNGVCEYAMSTTV
jgi:hypothetical protein